MNKLHLSLKSVSYYVLITGLVLVMACSIGEPKLPKWFVEWRIPIPQADFVMEEATDDSNIVLDTTLTGTTFLEISVIDSLDRQTVDPEDMAVLGDIDSTGDHIEDIDLGNLGPIPTDSIMIADILGGPLIPGLTIDVPGEMVTLDDQRTEFPTYIWAHAKSGQMTLELVNNTFLNFDSGTQITVKDTLNNQLGIADFPDSINAYGGRGYSDPPIDLADQTFVNRFLLTIRIPIKPEQQHLITEQDSASSIRVLVRINDLIVFEAECILPPQTITIDDSSSLLDERHHIYWGVIDHGQVNVDIQNQLEVGADVLITLPNIHDMVSGEVFTQSYYLDPLTQRQETIIIADKRIEDYPNPNSGETIDYLLYDVFVLSDSSGELVHISEEDSVLVKVIPDSLFFTEVYGILDRIDVPVDSVEKTDLFDASRIEGSVFLDSLNLRINLYNETDIPINITMNIQGSNDTRSVVLAPIDLIIPRVSDPKGGVLHKVLNINDPSPNIVDLMGILPSDVKITASAYVQGPGQISLNQAIWGDYEILSPLYLKLPENLIITSDKEEANADSNIKKIYVILDTYNGLPLSAQAFIYVSADSTNLFSMGISDSSTKCIVDNIVLKSGIIGEDGYVEQASTDKIEIELTKQQVGVFAMDTILYIGSKIIIDSTSTLVKFKPSDAIRINGWFKIKYLINYEEDEEK